MSQSADRIRRSMPVGAEYQKAQGGTHFRVWAPDLQKTSVVFNGNAHPETPLPPEGNGYFSGFLSGVRAGARYRFRVGDEAYPDPASRQQPHGPHDSSAVVDPLDFAWTDGNWPGVTLAGQRFFLPPGELRKFRMVKRNGSEAVGRNLIQPTRFVHSFWQSRRHSRRGCY